MAIQQRNIPGTDLNVSLLGFGNFTFGVNWWIDITDEDAIAIQNQAKIGILGGSALAAAIGLAILARVTRPEQQAKHTAPARTEREMPFDDRVGAPA